MAELKLSSAMIMCTVSGGCSLASDVFCLWIRYL